MKRSCLIALLVLGAAFQGCSDDEKRAALPGPTPLEEISIRTCMAAISRAGSAIDPDDPTMSSAAARAGHLMQVEMGAGAALAKADYRYDGGRWLPVGEALVFPDNRRQPLAVTLGKEGAVVQDGSAQALVDADPLAWERADQVPVRDLANVPMRHLKTLVEFELGTIAATEVRVDEAVAYHVVAANRWQAVVEPGISSFTVYVTVNGKVSQAGIGAELSPTGGEFLADNRYTLPLVLNGEELEVGTVGVAGWTEAEGGVAEGMTPTRYRIEGMENETISIYLYGSDQPVEIALDERGEAMRQAGVPVGVIERIVCGGVPVAVGREESGEIVLRIREGKVVFRDAVEGKIPVGTVEELAMVGEAAARGGSYVQTDDIDLMAREWKPLEGFAGVYDGGGKAIRRLHVSEGRGNGGLFASNAGTIRRVVVASVSALAGEWHAGVVCGENTGTIDACTNRASFTGAGHNTLGGICGFNNGGTVKDCRNEGALTVADLVPSDGTGGIVGYCGGGSIEKCVNAGDVGGKPAKTGGIAGQADACTVADCANEGDLILPWGAGDNGGGIVGVTYNATRIVRCRSAGTVTVEGSQAGGICGQLNGGGRIEACLNTGKVGAKWNSGGIAGQSTDAEIVACHNDGLVECQTTGWAGAGGICGYHKGTITACYHVGEVKGDSAIGAIVGEHNSGKIEYCYWAGSLEGIPAGGGGTEQGNAKFGAAWPAPSTHQAWRTTAEDPAAYWRTLGGSGAGYPKLSWEE